MAVTLEIERAFNVYRVTVIVDGDPVAEFTNTDTAKLADDVYEYFDRLGLADKFIGFYVSN